MLMGLWPQGLGAHVAYVSLAGPSSDGLRRGASLRFVAISSTIQDAVCLVR